MDERVAVNQRRWDEMAKLHEQTYFAADARIRDERVTSFELDEMGEITGQRICHLQCHLGGESLVLARMGASVVGLDFSEVAIDQARARAEAAGLADRASFVCASVDDAVRETGGGFEGVYTSWGVLCWLPDITAWARTVAQLLLPGGWLYLAETHPYAMSVRWPDYRYGGEVAMFNDRQGDYTDANAQFEHPESWEWNHGLGEVVTALARAGMRIDFLHERAVVRWHLGDEANVHQQADGLWTVPGSTLPLSFSLRAINE